MVIQVCLWLSLYPEEAGLDKHTHGVVKSAGRGVCEEKAMSDEEKIRKLEKHNRDLKGENKNLREVLDKIHQAHTTTVDGLHIRYQAEIERLKGYYKKLLQPPRSDT